MPDLNGVNYSRDELLRRVGKLEQAAGVRLVQLGDGAERGVRVLEFRTGSGLAFDVLVDRAFDIGRCEYAGNALAWLSPVGVVGPWFYEADGLGFLRSFGGGLLTTCGLEHAFAPAVDSAAQYAYPLKQAESYGLHGRVSGLPAKLIGYGEHWEGDECMLYAEGEVLQAAVFGEQLVLRRRIQARVGDSTIRIQDEVTNVGYNRTPHMLIYHVNVGWPVLDEDAELLAPVKTFEGREPGFDNGYRELTAPTAEFGEQAIEQELLTDADGRVAVGVVNRQLGLGVYQRYFKQQLPHHVVWRMLGEGTYVLGIEPSTNRIDGRRDARERGELIELGHGEQRSYELELGALTGNDAISAFEKKVNELHGEGARRSAGG